MELDSLPPYSPEFNPIERVWKLTRPLCTNNRYFSTLQDIAQSVQARFDRWSQPNESCGDGDYAII
jgi:transposase